MDKAKTSMREIKDIASRYSVEQIEGCISEEVETGKNVCLLEGENKDIISELARAEYIRQLIDQGMSLADAIRELARRMRRAQRGFGDENA